MIARTLFILSIISLTYGCHCDDVSTPDKVYEVTKQQCMTFDRKISVMVLDLNSTHGAISWSDATKLENFLEAKKKFNENVTTLNAN